VAGQPVQPEGWVSTPLIYEDPPNLAEPWVFRAELMLKARGRSRTRTPRRCRDEESALKPSVETMKSIWLSRRTVRRYQAPPVAVPVVVTEPPTAKLP